MSSFGVLWNVKFLYYSHICIKLRVVFSPNFQTMFIFEISDKILAGMTSIIQAMLFLTCCIKVIAF